MNRFVYKQLLDWKNNESKSVLIIGGVPGVGKKDLILKFAEEHFSTSNVIDLEKMKISDFNFNHSDKHHINIYLNIRGNKTKLIEIIHISKEYENYNFIVIDPFAKESRGSSQPVAASYLVIKPLSFEEFLFNLHRDIFNKLSTSVNDISDDLHNEILNIFIDYLIVGGLPSVIEVYKQKGLDFNSIREEQKNIFDLLEDEISLYYKKSEYKNLINIINNIYPTLLRENRKFKLSDISSSKRFVTFSKYFKILENLNIVSISRLLKNSPLEVDDKSIILYFFDTGLLGYLGNVPKELYKLETIFSNPLTLALALNFSNSEIRLDNSIPIYFWYNNMSKVEFIIKNRDNFIPIELKDDSSGKLKSLDSFNNKFRSPNSYRLNLKSPSIKDSLKTYPLYLAKGMLRKLLI